jgi:hypothetical protein
MAAMIAAGIGAAGSIAGGMLGHRSSRMSAEQKALLNAQTAQTKAQTGGMQQVNSTYQQVFDQAQKLGMDPSQYIASLTPQQRQAMGLVGSSLGFGQQDVTDLHGQIGGADYGNFGANDINEFMNPYTDSVVNATNADIDRQRQIALVGNEGAANSAGAFGGSRHGVADAGTNEAALRTTANADASLRSQGFQTAAQLAQQRAQQVGGFKVAGNAQLAQLLQQKYNMNAQDIDRLMSSGAVQQGNDQAMKDWQLKRLGIISGAQKGQIADGTSNNFSAPTTPDGFASTVQGAQWGANVGTGLAQYFANLNKPVGQTSAAPNSPGGWG